MIRHAPFLCIAALMVLHGCASQEGPEGADSAPLAAGTHPNMEVPRNGTWGIYSLELSSGNVSLIYGTDDEIQASALRLNTQGDELAFAKKTGGLADTDSEIFTIGVDGRGLQRITNDSYWDLYPAWSPEGGSIAFISRREKDLDIYVMDADGGGIQRLYDSGDNDADIDWSEDGIVFTSGFSIWKIDADGTMPIKLTSPENAGVWGSANLPIGDYDPRYGKNGSKIVFERLEDAAAANGGYNLFLINSDGSGETRLTSSGHAQGLASWSDSGERIAYVVAAIGNEGKYDIYMMDADGSGSKDITPDYFPPEFLCHAPVFSKDDSVIYFIGQWWN